MDAENPKDTAEAASRNIFHEEVTDPEDPAEHLEAAMVQVDRRIETLYTKKS